MDDWKGENLISADKVEHVPAHVPHSKVIEVRRKLVRRYFAEGLTTRAIATVVGVTINQVRYDISVMGLSKEGV